MSSINVSFAAKLAIATRRWIRNTRAPAAEAQNLMADLANNAAFVRAKPVFQYSADLSAIPASSATERTRWRFAFHAQPFTQYLRVQMLLALRDVFVPIKAYGQMKVTDAAGTVVGVALVRYGGTGLGSPSDVPSEFGGAVPVTVSDVATGTSLITLEPDADYFVEFADFQYARLVSAAVWEISLLPDTDNGYATNTTGAGSPIYADQRGLIAQTARLLHRRYASQLWNWTADSTALTLTATETNVVDSTSTTVTTTTPGVTLDMSRRVTLRTAAQGVPVVMWAYFASVTGSASAILKNSAGTALVTATASSAGWVRGTGYLPAASGKYDLHGSRTTAGTLGAVSLYELDYTPQTMAIAFTTVQSIRQATAGTGEVGTDWTVSVTIYDGTQSNVQVVFTVPRDNDPTSTGADSIGTTTDAEQVATGWSVTRTTTSTDTIMTYTIASLSAGTHTFSVAANVEGPNWYAFRWRDEGSFDVVATGSSNDVPAATGDTTTITVGGLTATGAWSPTSVATSAASILTVTVAPTTLASSGHSMTITIDTDEVTTGTPTTSSNPDGWTIGAWGINGSGQREVTVSKAGSITAGTTNTIAFSVTPSTAGTLRSGGQLTADNGFSATVTTGDLTVAPGSSLAPIAALTTGGF